MKKRIAKLVSYQFLLFALAGLQSPPVHAMGSQTKIEGLLLDFSRSAIAIAAGIQGTPNPIGGLSTGQCVNFGRMHTGFGVEAISYNVNTVCYMFHQVDDAVSAAGWCSQWVIPGGIDHCVPNSSGGGGSTVSTPTLRIEQTSCDTGTWEMYITGSFGERYKWQRRWGTGSWQYISDTTNSYRLMYTTINNQYNWRVATVLNGTQSAWSSTKATRNEICYVDNPIDPSPIPGDLQ